MRNLDTSISGRKFCARDGAGRIVTIGAVGRTILFVPDPFVLGSGVAALGVEQFAAAYRDELQGTARSRALQHCEREPWTRGQVYALTGGRCAYCATGLTLDTLRVDHVVPLVPRHGDPAGDDTLDNLVPSCARCNSRKSNRRLSFELASELWGGA